MKGFEDVWARRGEPVGVESPVEGGRLTGPAHPLDARDGHVYVIRLVGRPLTTINGTTDVLYIGQGTGGRVHQLWHGQHSACKRLAWAGWARRGAELRVRVEARADARPELTEVELLNAFLWEHGQAPVLNNKHEGWLPSRILTAAARGLREADGVRVRFTTEARNGPSGQPAAFTTVDLYGEPADTASWHWLGSLRWCWPTAWCAGDATAHGPGGTFVLVTRPDDPGADGWVPLGERYHQRELHPGSVRLGDPTSPGELPDLAALVVALTDGVRRWLPAEGVRGALPIGRG